MYIFLKYIIPLLTLPIILINYKKLKNKTEIKRISKINNSKFKNIIRNKKIALVGPSNYLFGKNLGSLIDSHDIVIKINKFNILNEADYGSRIDVLYYNFYKKLINIRKDIKFINASHPIKYKYIDNQSNFFKSLKKNTNIPHQNYIIENLDLNFIEMIKTIKFPTSGFWII